MAESTLFTSLDEAKKSHCQAYDGHMHHFNQHRTSTELYFLNLLREIHPNFYVVCTRRGEERDLCSFAAAGHAKIIKDDDDNNSDYSRYYSAPPSHSRTRGKPGVLVNEDRFSHFRCQWNNLEFLVYAVSYVDTIYRQEIKLDFILSPQSPGTSKEGENSNIDKLLMAVGIWGKQLHDEIYVFDESYWSKDKNLWTAVQGSSWEDVILEPTMKENLIKDAQGFFDNQKLYKSLSVPWKRGIILHGFPGNGKTISLKALINSLSSRPDPIPSLYVKNFDSCNGEKYSINQIFRKARKMAPCLLIFEDLDSLVQDKTRSYFLNEVDGLESNEGILMIGSTNHLNKLDAAITKRPSRFDRKYHFKLPREAERTAYCHFWRKKVLGNDMVDFPEELCPIIAKLTEGFSFAYMKELFMAVLLKIAGIKTDEAMGIDTGALESSAEPSDDGGSSDGHVVVDRDDANSETIKNTESTVEPESGAETSTKKSRILPEVEVAEALKDNLLLKVTIAQVTVLLDQMDNSEEDDKSDDEVKEDGNKCRGGQCAL